jgi:pSer/pThr/pTyr-binding forkhead associated (FHA) protein
MPQLEIRKKGRDKVRRREWPSSTQEISIGRSSAADIVLHHSSISRTHCTIEQSGNSWRIRDHHSRHGLKVNGVRRGEAVLGEGDQIHLGPYQLVFHATNAAAPSQPTTADRAPFERDSSDDSGIALEADESVSHMADAAEMGRLEAALLAARDDAARVRAQLQELQDRSAAESSAAATSAARIAALEQELSSARGHTAELHGRGPAALPAPSDDAGEEPRVEIDSLHVNLSRVKAEADEPKGELDLILSELAHTKLERDDLRREAEPLRAELARMQADRAESAARDARTMDEIDRLRAALAEASASQIQSADLEARSRANEELVQAFRQQVANALASLDETSDRLQRAEESLATVGAERTRVEELLAQVRAESEADRLEAEAARDQLAEMADRVRHEEDARLTAERDRERAIDDAIAPTAAQLAERTRELDVLRADFEIVRVDRDRVQQTAERLEHELQVRQVAPAPEPAALESLRQELTALTGRLAETERASQERQQRLAVAQQNIEQFRRAIADAQKERDTWSSRARLAQAQVENLKKELAENRQRIQAYESLLVDYVTQLQATGDLDAAVVEMSPDEIRRAQRAGATIVELDRPRR